MHKHIRIYCQIFCGNAFLGFLINSYTCTNSLHVEHALPNMHKRFPYCIYPRTDPRIRFTFSISSLSRDPDVIIFYTLLIKTTKKKFPSAY